jgi:hypothetical protein
MEFRTLEDPTRLISNPVIGAKRLGCDADVMIG